MAYAYDVFVSYRNHGAVSTWVREFFQPLLRSWLEASKPAPTCVFIDTDGIETGDAWPERLETALRSSRILVPVFSADYFFSPWCLAEYSTMRAREKVCGVGVGSSHEPRGLIWPVKFNDGEFFLAEAKLIQQRDYGAWALTGPAFRSSAVYVEFEEDVRSFAERLAERLQDVPEWDAEWPIEKPDPEPRPAFPLPRL